MFVAVVFIRFHSLTLNRPLKPGSTLKDLAKEQQRIAGKRNTEEPDDEIASKQIESAASMLEFLERARNGEMMPPEVIIQYSTYFQDDLTLDNMPRMQLINVSYAAVVQTLNLFWLFELIVVSSTFFSILHADCRCANTWEYPLMGQIAF